jgi:glycosyltransferase involved in cell wall biosynthesis
VRVLHVTQPTSGGVARYIETISRWQIERGWSVGIACPSSDGLATQLESIGARHFEWNAKRAGYGGIRREIDGLRVSVQSFEPDVVHLHSSKAGLAGRALLRGTVATVFQPHAWSFHASRLPVVELWERLAARWAHVIVCVSQAERDEGLARGITGELCVVPNAVDPTAFAPVGVVERLTVRRSLDVDDAPLVVCVGRLARQKGQDSLLAIWPRIRAQVGNASLALVGDGPLRLDLERQALPGVRLAGHADDVRPWLIAADVVALPSRWEGMSTALLEAMAMGKSAVASDVAGARECLRDGRGCVLSAVDAAYADAVARRLVDRRLADGEGRRARAWTLAYTTHDLCDQLAETYACALTRWQNSDQRHARVAA